MDCNDLYNLPFTKIPKTDERIKNQMISNNIHDQGLKGTCWSYAISTMLRGSLKLFISKLDQNGLETQIKAAKDKLDHKDHHRQLRYEIITGPIPKNLSKDYPDLKKDERKNHSHYLQLACERVMQFNKISKSYLEL